MTRSKHTSDRDAPGDPSTPTSDLLALQRAVQCADPQHHERLLANAVEWARSVRLHALLLDLVLAGEVDIESSSDGTDLSFRQHAGARILPFDRSATLAGAQA